LQALVDEIRARQNALREKLGEAITKRKSIEQLFVEYEGTQHDIERSLSGIEHDQKGDALEARIGNLSQFTKVTESRFQELEQSKQMLLGLRTEFEAIQARLLPLKDDRSGVKALIHQLNDICAQLVASMEALERDGDISLSERVKRIAENRQGLSERVSNLAEELSRLDNSHKDINSLFARLSNELRARYPAGVEAG
jgi:chromosome segregation ATPase